MSRISSSISGPAMPSRSCRWSSSAVRTLINAIDARMHWVIVSSILDSSPRVIAGGDLFRFQPAGKKDCYTFLAEVSKVKVQLFKSITVLSTFSGYFRKLGRNVMNENYQFQNYPMNQIGINFSKR